MKPYLYFVTRDDLHEGRRAAQILHAGLDWVARHGAHNGAVLVYSVPDEDTLLANLPVEGRTVLWREPDLKHQATAFATDLKPTNLCLLGKPSA